MEKRIFFSTRGLGKSYIKAIIDSGYSVDDVFYPVNGANAIFVFKTDNAEAVPDIGEVIQKEKRKLRNRIKSFFCSED